MFFSESWEFVASGKLTPFKAHAKESGSVPVAPTFKTTSWPAKTVWLLGFWVIVGEHWTGRESSNGTISAPNAKIFLGVRIGVFIILND